MLKNEISEALCVLRSDLDRESSKIPLDYLNFKTKFHSRTKEILGRDASGPRAVSCVDLFYNVGRVDVNRPSVGNICSVTC
jgi:hypothetical protein